MLLKLCQFLDQKGRPSDVLVFHLWQKRTNHRYALVCQLHRTEFDIVQEMFVLTPGILL
ncbi:Uncharacterised protein [Shigella sonnei]|nr:Uncharacterised protein [Shigella sonnei]